MDLSPQQKRQARAAGWLLKGPLGIPGICGLIADYTNEFKGKCVWKSLLPETVTDLAGLPDGKLVSGSSDHIVRIWDAVGNGDCLLTLAEHTSGIHARGVMPDGKLASGSSDGTVRVWDSATGVCLLTLTSHTDWVWALAVLPDGKLASGAMDKTVCVWE